LTKARDELYIDVKPGFVDTGAAHKQTKDVFTSYAPPAPKKKFVKHEQAEQQRAAAAQAQLAAARAKVAEANAAKAAAQMAKSPGATNVSKTTKPVKVNREKIRFGQAPRTSLPSASVETATTNNGALSGQAPGVAMAMTDSTTTISTGTGVDTSEDPLAPKSGPVRKTRFSDRAPEQNEQRLQTKVVKTEVKASNRPVQADAQTVAAEKQQAAPLGLNGDTAKKVKPKRVKGQPKERLQEEPTKPVDTSTPVAPTANKSLVATPSALSPDAAKTAPSADRTTLPPADTPAPGAQPQGQPIPAATSTEPNAPATTPAPH
jgi:peptidyl-prolyl cis-trans isomerase SurA